LCSSSGSRRYVGVDLNLEREKDEGGKSNYERIFVDTNCISELVRIKPEPRVVSWMQATEETLLYVSVLTLGEIRKGLAGLPQGKRRTASRNMAEIELGARFCRQNLPIDVLGRG